MKNKEEARKQLDFVEQELSKIKRTDLEKIDKVVKSILEKTDLSLGSVPIVLVNNLQWVFDWLLSKVTKGQDDKMIEMISKRLSGAPDEAEEINLVELAKKKQPGESIGEAIAILNYYATLLALETQDIEEPKKERRIITKL